MRERTLDRFIRRIAVHDGSTRGRSVGMVDCLVRHNSIRLALHVVVYRVTARAYVLGTQFTASET